ncbi:type VII secretion integral membrane protein EccD [Micromonospora rubida]|uniref:type VII secretion integral membrane protein EccD n=1 Tax=Micromonospora rubida TaxID=2697657 RepID=UPI00137851AE|nr:type VII secretion integral membrane protein EccD [Micromonospora rubida]NBE80124.1 type VII secretion integral membrane protein EccD [Micromonospora rubida]
MSQDRGELCRLLVVGPTSQVDVSLPTHIPLADMMPALLSALGPDLADRGLEHSGWIARRLGGPALDESRTVADLELLDGEMVYVRPRTDQIPPLAYDDLIDGVSAGIKKRSGLWRPQTTRLAALLLFAVWLGAGLAAMQGWRDDGSRTVLLAASAVLCCAAAYAVAHRLADRVLAGILGGACVTATVLVALDVVAQKLSGAEAESALTGLIFVGATVGAVTALLVCLLVVPQTGRWPVIVGLACLWLLVTAAGLLREQAGLGWTAVAAVLVTVTTVLRLAVPAATFKLAGFTLPEMPVEPAELQKDIEPHPAADVLDGAALADHFMTALYTVLGLVSGVAMVWLVTAPGWSAPLAAWLAAAAQILVTRAMTSTWHRLALAGPALVAMVVWCVTAAGGRGTSAALSAIGFCLALVLVCGAAARMASRRRFNPIWGRLGDWTHTVAVAALLPTAVVIMGVIAVIRARVG